MSSNPRVPYELASQRPKLEPPDGKRLIVHLVTNVEYWPFDAKMPRGVVTAPHGVLPVPDVVNYSWFEYGLRVGFWRILQTTERLGIKAVMSLNAVMLERHPRVTQAAIDAGIGERLGLGKRLVAVRNTRTLSKADMKNNDYCPDLDVDPQTYEVRADGKLLTCEPATELALAQRYFLF